MSPRAAVGAAGRRSGGLVGRLLRHRTARRRETEDRLRLQHELSVSRQRLARWQQHADSYERQLGRVQRERAHLLAWLAALHPASAVLTPLTGPGQGPQGAYRLCLVAGGWHLSWRIAPGDLALFAHVPPGPEPVPHPVPDGDAPDQEAVIRRHTQLLACEGTLSAGFAAAAGRQAPGPPAGS
ncbi:hypothetical protein [Streptomyces sp. bgisy022]|uniref:hypothetical protein n=1 Tax=Streptomyces sp. bgisy022 TaxID=3413769 RepID=UPI003D725327